MDTTTMISVKDAALKTGYTPQNITLLIRTKKLKNVTRRGRKYFIQEAEVLSLFKEVGHGPTGTTLI